MLGLNEVKRHQYRKHETFFLLYFSSTFPCCSLLSNNGCSRSGYRFLFSTFFPLFSPLAFQMRNEWSEYGKQRAGARVIDSWWTKPQPSRRNTQRCRKRWHNNYWKSRIFIEKICIIHFSFSTFYVVNIALFLLFLLTNKTAAIVRPSSGARSGNHEGKCQIK